MIITLCGGERNHDTIMPLNEELHETSKERCEVERGVKNLRMINLLPKRSRYFAKRFR